MKPWFFACALALIAAGTALAQESPPDGSTGGGMGGGMGGMGGGSPGGGHRRGGKKSDSGDDKPPPPPAAEVVALDHAGYEAAWTQCHLNVDLMRRLDCYERLHDDQEAALKTHGGPPPR
jgi:hypothetical protein